MALQGGLWRAALGGDVLPPLLPRKQWLHFTAAEDFLFQSKKINFQTAAASSFLGMSMLSCLVVPDLWAELQLDLTSEFSDALDLCAAAF